MLPSALQKANCTTFFQAGGEPTQFVSGQPEPRPRTRRGAPAPGGVFSIGRRTNRPDLLPGLSGWRKWLSLWQWNAGPNAAHAASLPRSRHPSQACQTASRRESPACSSSPTIGARSSAGPNVPPCVSACDPCRTCAEPREKRRSGIWPRWSKPRGRLRVDRGAPSEGRNGPNPCS